MLNQIIAWLKLQTMYHPTSEYYFFEGNILTNS